MTGGAPLDAGVLARWYWDHILSPVPVLTPSGVWAGRARRHAARLGVAAALLVPAAGVVAVGPASAATPIPDFGQGSTLSSNQIRGDSSGGGTRGTKDAAGKWVGVKRLTAASIGGDGNATPDFTGSHALIDGSGLKWFLNDNITFSTSSSASAAMSEASYTHAVPATTSAGGTTPETLNDAYDGYETLCISIDNSVGATCETGNANFGIYNKNGAATPDPNCPSDREFDFNDQTINGLTVSREVFVPDNDSFARWIDIVHNPGSTTADATLIIANNLGSDNNTVITDDSSGNTTPTTADRWAATFQNYTGSTSTDPRLGHVFGGVGAPAGLTGLHFQNGDDNPFWGYTLHLAPGQTQIIMNYGVAQPSKADAASKSAQLAQLADTNQLNCMTATQENQVMNFVLTPSAETHSYSTPHDATLAQPAPGVLASDPGADALTAVLASGPSHAANFSLNSDGSFTYKPAPGFAGTDSFTYRAKNQSGGMSAPTKVTITVVGVAPDITSADAATFTVGKRGTFSIKSTGIPTPRITKASGLPKGLAFHAKKDGTAEISGSPKPGTHGTYKVTLTAANGQTPNATQQLTLTIKAGARPSASAHSYISQPGRNLVRGAPGVLRGDKGEHPLTAVLVSGSVRNGTVSLKPNGSFTYTPSAGFIGTASFRYKAKDLDGGVSAPAAVTVFVNRLNVAQIMMIEQSLNQILASYRSIALSARHIVADVRNRATIREVNALLGQAASLAKQAEALEAKVKGRKFGPDQLADIARGRMRAAMARSRASKARVIASKARAAGK